VGTLSNCLLVLAKTNSFVADKEERWKKLITYMLTQKKANYYAFPNQLLVDDIF